MNWTSLLAASFMAHFLMGFVEGQGFHMICGFLAASMLFIANYRVTE